MIDYFETKSQPITKAMVLKAYGYVRAKKGYPNGELHHCGMNKISYA
jgi:hypothetical protein